MRYDERGLIPRAIQALFSAFRARSDMAYTARVSYLEIYNDSGRDLLGESMRSIGGEEELPKVSVAEGRDGTVLLRGLSSHPWSSKKSPNPNLNPNPNPRPFFPFGSPGGRCPQHALHRR